MTKTDLIDQIAVSADLTKADSGRAVNALLDALTGALQRGESVSLVGFGTFTVKARPARTGRNPQTGEVLQIEASRIPSFKPGKGLKDQVNA
jgi:DNA-binding protein HU-beta